MTLPDFSCLDIPVNFSVLGVVEADQPALKVAPNKILLSTIATICENEKKWQNITGTFFELTVCSFA